MITLLAMVSLATWILHLMPWIIMTHVACHFLHLYCHSVKQISIWGTDVAGYQGDLSLSIIEECFYRTTFGAYWAAMFGRTLRSSHHHDNFHFLIIMILWNWVEAYPWCTYKLLYFGVTLLWKLLWVIDRNLKLK